MHIHPVWEKQYNSTIDSIYGHVTTQQKLVYVVEEQ